MDLPDGPPVRCSPWTRDAGLSPAGSAGSPAGWLLVDVDLPWPGDVGAVPRVRALAGLTAARNLRVQATVPVADGRPRLAWYAPLPGEGFSSYVGREITAAGPEPEDVAAAAEALLSGAGEPVAGEVLVCTHGARDVCCGGAGTTLAMQLAAGDPAGLGRPVRRTSHTGGHRFAPTAVVLPEGTAWAWADGELLRAVCGRRGAPADVVARYRGCAGLTGPAAQALEGAVLADHGWSVWAGRRSVEAIGGDRLRLVLDGADGGRAVWEAEVAAGRTVAVPDCGRPLAESRKSATELVVAGLERTA